MKTVTWIACGIGLNIAAAALHGSTAPQDIMTSGIAGPLPKLLLVAAGNVCIWRGLRSAIRDLWGSATRKNARKPQRRFADDAEPVSDFDADAAFERYMAQRETAETEPEPERRPVPPPRSSARAPVQSGFGRKVV